MVTPSGNPAWARSNDYTSYGGHAQLKNYNGLPIVNPQTDVGAEHLARISADIAAVSMMGDFAHVKLTMASGSNAPTVTACTLMTGIYTGTGYSGTSPPTGFPRVLGISNGVCAIKFTGIYTDPYSISSTFRPTFPRASLAESSVGAAYKTPSWTSGTDTVMVRVQTSSGSAVTGKTVAVSVA